LLNYKIFTSDPPLIHGSFDYYFLQNSEWFVYVLDLIEQINV
jgi:hypothetical protein